MLGAYGYRNAGDEAILAGLLSGMHSDAHVTVVSRAPAETTALHGVRSVGIAQAPGELRCHRSLLIGGGGLFGRDMGRLGQLIAPFGAAAVIAGKAVAVHGVGVDSRLPWPTIAALRFIARHAISFTVRDTGSADALRGWGINAGRVEDLSTGMAPGSRREARTLLRTVGLDPARPIVGLCLTALETATARDVGPAVRTLVEQMPDVQFCLIPMSQHPFVPTHNDLVLGLRLQAESPRIVVIDGLHHPSRILALFELLSAAVCMRFHSLLFADRAGVPIIAVPYADKCRSWLGEHGMVGVQPSGPSLVASVREAMGPRLARSA